MTDFVSGDKNNVFKNAKVYRICFNSAMSFLRFNSACVSHKRFSWEICHTDNCNDDEYAL